MAKDPAFLFYSSDFLIGVSDLTFDERGKYITLLCMQHQKGPLNEKMIQLTVGSISEDLRKKFSVDGDGNLFNQRLLDEATKRNKYTESRRQSSLKRTDDNVRVYLVKDNNRGTYKIGSSVNPTRRYNELSNQLNPAIMGDAQGERNLTLVWYSDLVLRSEENLLHNHFSDKKLSGEWFSLTKEDLTFIFNKYTGTHVNRTYVRTENVNVNESVIKNEFKDIIDSYNGRAEIFKSAWSNWLEYRKEIKKPYKSPKSMYGKLKELMAYDDDTAAQMVTNSINNQWQGIFPLKDNQNSNGTTTATKSNSNSKQTGLANLNEQADRVLSSIGTGQG